MMKGTASIVGTKSLLMISAVLGGCCHMPWDTAPPISTSHDQDTLKANVAKQFPIGLSQAEVERRINRYGLDRYVYTGIELNDGTHVLAGTPDYEKEIERGAHQGFYRSIRSDAIEVLVTNHIPHNYCPWILETYAFLPGKLVFEFTQERLARISFESEWDAVWLENVAFEITKIQ